MTADNDHDDEIDWAAVDSDADAATDYLDSMTGLEVIREAKHRSHRLLHPSDGDRILDVGCGVGDDVRMLAEQVAPSGTVIGLDRSESLVETARERTDESAPVRFRVGDALALPFEDGEMDASRADRVLQHLEDPRAALAELRRVTRRGGRIALTDPDWSSCLLTAPDVDFEVTRTVTDGRWACAANPAIGSRLYALARGIGLTDVAVDPTTAAFTSFETANEAMSLENRVEMAREAGALRPDQAEQWLADVRKADREGLFFCSLTGFTVAGTVPHEE